MPDPAIEIRFTLPVGGVAEEHREEAERKAREAYVLELLRQGEISAGRAAELLSVDRGRLAELMSMHGISPFGERMTREELEREVVELTEPLGGR
jgi:predicted HTH domain antitoxin